MVVQSLGVGTAARHEVRVSGPRVRRAVPLQVSGGARNRHLHGYERADYVKHFFLPLLIYSPFLSVLQSH